MNNSMSDPKLEQGLLGVSWDVSHEGLELTHPGGKWHLPLRFIFDIDGKQPLKALSCWLRVPLGGVPNAVERIEAACGPFLASNIRNGDCWTQFLRPGFVVLLLSRKAVGQRHERLNLTVGYHRNGPLA